MLFLLILLLANCAECRPREEPPLDVADLDGDLPEDPSSKLCPLACERMRDLGCSEGFPFRPGDTCDLFCARQQENGRWIEPFCAMGLEGCEGLLNCDDLFRCE